MGTPDLSAKQNAVSRFAAGRSKRIQVRVVRRRLQSNFTRGLLMKEMNSLRVIVHYVAAEEPFRTEADRDETVGQLKARVLTAFGLTEGQTSDGNIVSYTLFHERTPLENPNQTLGEIAGHQKILQLKLSQQITQG
jgi:hypothetical protein